MVTLDSGCTLGRYTLLLPVGQGGQAAVWAASFAGLAGFEKTVAVKTLLPPRHDEEAHIERFTDEALLATRLRHPNVVEVLDFGEEDGVLYIVMPWIDGEPINTIIDVATRKGGVPLPIASNLMGQACRGLHAAHELTSENGEPLGLVHRDVSPENILVTREGTAKIADFGVATACGHLGLVTGETDLGRARGKVWYMAPEELWGEPVDRRSDLFALGVVLYRMTTGRHPFDSGNGRESVRRLLAGAHAIPPRTFLPDYPEALENVLLRVLAESPEYRHRTAIELRQALFQAVAPATDDDVAQFLSDLFAARRLERDARLRQALDALPEPPVARLAFDERRFGTHRSIHPASRTAPRTPSHARAFGLGLAGAVVGMLVSCALLQPGRVAESLPAVEAKAAVATPAPAPPPLDVESMDTLVVSDTRDRSEIETTPEKPARADKRAFDVSPVGDVGF